MQQALFIAFTNFLAGYLLRHFDDLNWRRRTNVAIIVRVGAVIPPTMNAVSYISLLVLIEIEFFSWQKKQGPKAREGLMSILGIISVVVPSLLFVIAWGDFTAEMSRIAPSYYVANSPGIRDLMNVPA